jgi:hypothetical protein
MDAAEYNHIDLIGRDTFQPASLDPPTSKQSHTLASLLAMLLSVKLIRIT